MSAPARDREIETYERLARMEERQVAISKTTEDGFATLSEKLGSLDERLRKTEVSSASFGAAAGAVMSLGVSLIAAKLTGKS